jgi:hypothetical protein
VNEYDLPLFEKFIGTDLDLCSYQHLNILCGRKQWRRYVGEETGKRRWVMRKKKPIELSLKSPRCTLITPHLTSPDWEKNGVQGTKNHKKSFCIRKKGIRFFT